MTTGIPSIPALALLGSLALVAAGAAAARAAAPAGSPDEDLRRLSLPSRCEGVQTAYADPGALLSISCGMDREGRLPVAASAIALLGDPARRSALEIEGVGEALFLTLLKEKALELLLEHVALRDSLDTNLLGPASSAYELGLLAVPLSCTDRFPNLKKLRGSLARQLRSVMPFRSSLAPDPAEASSEASRHLEGIYASMFFASTAGMGCANDQACGSIVEAARKIDEDIVKPDGSLKKRLALDLLRRDPALYEFVGENRGACQLRPGDPNCRRAFQVIAEGAAGLNLSRKEVRPGARSPEARSDDPRYRRLLEVYLEANRAARERVVSAVLDSCRQDGSEWLLSAPLTDEILRENPGFTPVFCSLLRKRGNWQAKGRLYLEKAAAGVAEPLDTASDVGWVPPGLWVAERMLKARLSPAVLKGLGTVKSLSVEAAVALILAYQTTEATYRKLRVDRLADDTRLAKRESAARVLADPESPDFLGRETVRSQGELEKAAAELDNSVVVQASLLLLLM